MDLSLSLEVIIGLVQLIMLMGGFTLAWRELRAKEPVLTAQAAQAAVSAASGALGMKDKEVINLQAVQANLTARFDALLRDSTSHDLRQAKQIAKLDQDLEEERVKRRKLQEDLETERKRNNTLSDDLKAVKANNAELKSKYEKVLEENRTLRNRLDALEKERKEEK